MKVMRKRIILMGVLAILLTSTAFSQVSFGIRGGINFQNLNGKDANGDKLKNSLKIGFHAGVEAPFPVADDFFLQPGLLFSTKGASDLDCASDVKAYISYIELPVHFAYKPVLGSGRLIIGIGPYFAYGVMGKLIQNDVENDIKFTNDITASSDGTYFLRPFDAGADIFFGYELASDFLLSLMHNSDF